MVVAAIGILAEALRLSPNFSGIALVFGVCVDCGHLATLATSCDTFSTLAGLLI